jgi:predicted nucleotidyltransferase
MKIHGTVKTLTSHEAVHSIMVFGSSARGEATEDSDIDICIIEDPGSVLGLHEKLRITRDLPEKLDVSFFHDLPLNIRQRVLQEGKIIHTKDSYHVYTLIKEVESEMFIYRRMQEEYHKEVMNRVKARLTAGE